MTLPWDELAPLEERSAWLLEASAGTGKTYQIASLVLRLVARYGLSIDSILVMTFTNAATAELRSRIRRRLRAALEVVDGQRPEDGSDRVLADAVANVEPAELRRRLLVALQGFDRARISTIHGFSEQVLAEFAFDSGQDGTLTLLEDPAAIREQVIDDALSALWSRCTPRMVPILTAAGVSRDALLRIAYDTSGTTPPTITPETHPASLAWSDVWQPVVDQLEKQLEELETFRSLWMPHGALQHHPAAVAFVGAGASFDVDTTEQLDAAVRFADDWIASDGGLGISGDDALNVNTARRADLVERLEIDVSVASRLIAQRYVARRGKAQSSLLSEEAYGRLSGGGGSADLLHTDWLRARWVGPGALEAQSFWPLAQAYTELREGFDKPGFRRRFSPLAHFGAIARPRIEAELERRRAITFDSMIVRLDERITQTGGPDSPLAHRLRERFHAVLVDEFQDTDTAQWNVLRQAFLGERRLFLIGDPKQAIYGFRGANVHVYVSAAALIAPDRRRTMTTNWRSDGTVIEAMNVLWRPGSDAFDQQDVPTGHPTFDYIEVSPAPGNAGRGTAPGLDVAWIEDDAEPLSKPATMRRILAQLQQETVAWLSGRKAIAGRDRLRPRDLAVLVASHREAAQVKAALARVGVPAVTAATRSVFDSPACAWLVHWLRALGDPGSESAARTAATTPLVGWTAEELAWSIAALDHRARADSTARGTRPPQVAERSWEGWLERLHAAARSWPRHGFIRTIDAEFERCSTFERLLAMPEGERLATDLRHLLELLHAHERTHRPGPSRLADWLAEQVAQAIAAGAKGTDATAQRLESDADAVTIETIHVSKGLEYPIVLLPFAWSARKPQDRGEPLKLQTASGCTVDLSPRGSTQREDALKAARREERRESIRKLYVALTRAKHRTVAWFGLLGEGATEPGATALGGLLLRDPETPGYALNGATSAAHERLAALVQRSNESIASSVATQPPEPPPRWEPQDAAPEPIAPARIELTGIASPWRTSSFTSLSKRIGHAGMDHDEKAQFEGLAPEDAPTAEPVDPPETMPSAVRARAERLALAADPAAPLVLGHGTGYGSFVHQVLEELDFETLSAKDGRPLERLVEESAAAWGQERAAAGELALKLSAILRTPLDGGATALTEACCLARLPLADRLDELEFNLRLGAGADLVLGSEQAGDHARLAAVASILETEPSTAGAPWVRDFADSLSETSLVGILTGKLDLVFRARDLGGRLRYYVADYKTNRSAPASEDARYDRATLEGMMSGSAYHLQALIYTVALHRHLASRLPGYDYDRDIGGYLYLFVRGFQGPQTVRDRLAAPRHPPTCTGVYADRWARSVVERVDRALWSGLHGGRSR